MWKYIVTAIIWTYYSLPQCDLGNGATCLALHGQIKQDTIKMVFYNIDSAKKWVSSMPKKYDSFGDYFVNQFKIDSALNAAPATIPDIK